MRRKRGEEKKGGSRGGGEENERVINTELLTNAALIGTRVSRHCQYHQRRHHPNTNNRTISTRGGIDSTDPSAHEINEQVVEHS